MSSTSGRELARLLELEGLAPAPDKRQPSRLRQGRKRNPSVPIHGNRSLKTGLLRHLAKLAEIPDGELR